MQPAELTVENAEMSTSLGAGFWTGWAAGMAATLGAFAGAVYLFTFTDFLFGGATLQSVIGHGYVADASQPESAAQHCALQHCDQHLRCVLRFLQQRTESAVQFAIGIGALGAGAGHVLDVATGAEMPAGTAEH